MDSKTKYYKYVNSPQIDLLIQSVLSIKFQEFHTKFQLLSLRVWKWSH